MIKFRCKHCSHKIGVKDEHAGRKARCPKCKEPIRVPKPKPPEDEFELEMVVPGDGGLDAGGGGDDFDLEVVGGGGGGDLAALAAMEAGAQPVMVSADQVAATCPSCKAKAKPGAALCVSCGYNFKSGKKTDVTVSSLVDTKPPPADATADDPNYMSPGKMILSGLVLMVIAVALFYYLWDFENSNDPSRRIHSLIAALYNLGGKYAASMPFFGLGLMGVLKGMYDMRKA